jgi:hypothetical protein
MQAILDVEVEIENPYEYVDYIANHYQISELLYEMKENY